MILGEGWKRGRESSKGEAPVKWRRSQSTMKNVTRILEVKPRIGDESNTICVKWGQDTCRELRISNCVSQG